MSNVDRQRAAELESRIARDPSHLCGEILSGRYRVDGVGNGGGTETVSYNGVDLTTNRAVMVRCPRVVGASVPAAQLHGFLGRARLQIGLTHPALVTLHDCGVIGSSIPFVVLDAVKGAFLAEEIMRRAAGQEHFSAPDLAEIFEPLLEALGHAHQHGVVHGALSPWRIVLVSEGERLLPKLIDFGVQPGPKDAVWVETPEASDPSLGKVSERTDVFVMGTIVAATCLLRHPNASRSTAPIARNAGETADAQVARLRPDLPGGLARVIGRATSVHPDDRFGDARELCSAFRDALRAPSARPPARTPRRAAVQGGAPVQPAVAQEGRRPPQAAREAGTRAKPAKAARGGRSAFFLGVVLVGAAAAAGAGVAYHFGWLHFGWLP